VALQSRGIISLCTGYGGLDLGLRLAGVEARASVYVERDIKAARLLVTRIEAGKLDPADIWSDLKTFDASAYRGSAYLTAGYPCQPFSAAGKKLGKKDPRHLWPYVAAAIWDAKPRRVFLENVDAHLRLGFREVATELRAMGYRVAAGLFSSEETGNTHRRLRLFALAELAHADDKRSKDGYGRSRSLLSGHNTPAIAESGGDLENASRNGRNGSGREDRRRRRRVCETVSELAVSNGRRFPELGASHSYHGDYAPGYDSDRCGSDVAQRSSGRRGELRQSSRRGGFTDGRGKAVADCDTKRRENERRHDDASIRDGFVTGGMPLFPPGPEDFASWIRVIERNPEVKPAVCGVAYGSSSRVDRLRLLGNGVDPLVAAHAHRTLEYALALAE
jgi:DNA (cytosine-5)-methyltransferase 1